MRVNPVWTLGVLAGGHGARMGRDKAGLVFGTRTLMEHQIRRLASPGVPVIVGTRVDGPGRSLGHPWVADVLPNAGPLASIAAMLGRSETPFVLVVPCDMPLLPPDLGDRMMGHARGVEGILPVVEGSVQPLPALVSVELLPRLEELLRGGEFRMTSYVDHAACALVPWPSLYPGLDPREVLLNVNEPKDLELASHLLGIPSSR